MISNLQTQREKIYSALCWTLSERIDQVDWESFSEDDWSRFGNMAITEGVAPLIHWTFKHEDTFGIEIPTTVKAQLMAAYYNTTAQNQVMFKELERILEALEKAGIPVIVLKGAALATTVYPEIGLRPMGDLDLLVPKDKINKANQCLTDLGYSEARIPLSKKLNRKIGHHIELIGGPNDSVMVELHWSLIAGDADIRTAPMDWFWEQTKSWEEYETALFLNPTANLLYLSAHLMLQHREAQAKLSWLNDFHLLICQYHKTISWQELAQRSYEFNWAGALQLSLQESLRYFKSPVPQSVFEYLSNHQDPQIAHLIHLKSTIDQTSVDRNIARIMGLRWPTRLQYVIIKLFPSPAFMKWYYEPNPKWLWPLYYFYRWMRLIQVVAKSLI